MYLLLLNIKTGDYFVKYDSIHWFSKYAWLKCVKQINKFGRQDFAIIWRDFYNGNFDRSELVKKLDSILY